MASELKRKPTKNIKTSRSRMLAADTGKIPIMMATTIISEPLRTPRNDPHKISPVTASSAETGVAIRES